jgi:hypothetical protein
MTHGPTGRHDDPTVETDMLTVHLPLWISKLLDIEIEAPGNKNK